MKTLDLVQAEKICVGDQINLHGKYWTVIAVKARKEKVTFQVLRKNLVDLVSYSASDLVQLRDPF